MSFSLSTEIDLGSELTHGPPGTRTALDRRAPDRRRTAFMLAAVGLGAALIAFMLACLVNGQMPLSGQGAAAGAGRDQAEPDAKGPTSSIPAGRQKAPSTRADQRDRRPGNATGLRPSASPSDREQTPAGHTLGAHSPKRRARALWAQARSNPAVPEDPKKPPRPSLPPARGSTFDLKPYFADVPADPAALLMQGDVKGARAAAERLTTQPDFKQRTQAQFVLALALAEQGECEKALTVVHNLLPSYALMGPYLWMAAAKCNLKRGRPALAGRAALKVDPKSPLYEGAQLVLGVALIRQQKWTQAADLYTRFLTRHPAIGVSEARYLLAVALGKMQADAKKILTQLQLVRAEFPLSLSARKAQATIRQLTARMKPNARRYWLRLPCRLAVVRARKLMSARRYRQAAAELRAAARQRNCSAADRCAAFYELGQAVYKGISRTRAAGLFERAVRHCDPNGPADLRAKAKYQAGRANRAAGRYARALAFFSRVEREHPHHSYADDARFRRAETYEMMGKKNLAAYAYRSLVERYPKGDMRQEALWRLLRQAYFKGRLDTALSVVKLAIRLVPTEEGPHAEGRTLYWMGRILLKKGKPAEALKAYATAVHAYPLSYYALMALERIRQLDAPAAARLQTKMAPDSTAPTWQFGTDPVLTSAGFRRATEMARLGLARHVVSELRHLGLEVPKKAPKPSELAALTPEKRKRLWAAAVLLDRAGMYHLSHWLPRHTLKTYARSYPRGANLKYWQVAFPMAYDGLVKTHSTRFRVPYELLMALIREESAFNPKQVSRARAIGLTQLLVSTARRFARRLRVRITSSTLKRPEVNIPVGAAYLGFLLKMFKDRIPLAVASYNCGERRIKRWLQKNTTLEVDEFVEQIPIDETRMYTKRVLGSAFAYRALSRPADPAVPIAFTLPVHAAGQAKQIPPAKVAVRP